MTARSAAEARIGRLLDQPGAPHPSRIDVVPTRVAPIAGSIEPGRTVLAGLAALFDAAGHPGGTVRLTGGFLDPVRFVIPAHATDGKHAAFYSDTHAPEGGVELIEAWASVGWKDGARFVHCHGRWQTARGDQWMGHLLNDLSVVTETVSVEGLATLDAHLTVESDDETGFSLFAATGARDDAPSAAKPAALIRLRPNIELFESLEQAIGATSLARGSIYGIGSMTDLCFAGGEVLFSLATEVMVTGARFSRDGEQVVVDRIDAAGVGVDGSIKSGSLARGANRVCITAELLIVGDEVPAIGG